MQPAAIRTALLASVIGSLALAACTTPQAEGGHAAQAVAGEHAPAAHHPPPPGIVRWGDSFALMAQQYAPRAGPYVATGASAWVPPAPPPAFAALGPLPPADPPAPPPAAVANRSPGAPAAAPPAPAAAAQAVRPEAAQPEAAPAAAAPSPALRTAGLALFNDFSCGACHALADAGAAGAIGPSLDRNPRLTRAFAIDVIANGRGAMPAFAGQMNDAEIATLADYIVQFARK